MHNVVTYGETQVLAGKQDSQNLELDLVFPQIMNIVRAQEGEIKVLHMMVSDLACEVSHLKEYVHLLQKQKKKGIIRKIKGFIPAHIKERIKHLIHFGRR
jgi:hypothetical protein